MKTLTLADKQKAHAGTWAGTDTTMNYLDDTADHLPLQPDGSLDLVALGASIFDAPQPPPVVINPSDLNADLHECRDLAADLHITRELLLAALADVAARTKTLAAATATISRQREELRRYTASAVIGGAA